MAASALPASLEGAVCLSNGSVGRRRSRKIHGAIEAYGAAARTAKALGFDGVEIHGAHGYLIDQFLWDQTNLREGRVIAATVGRRTRFATEVIQEVRLNVGAGFPGGDPIVDLEAAGLQRALAANPEEWAAIVPPPFRAGVDAFHLSQRKYWQGELGTDENLATWTKRLMGKPTITVGSITLDNSAAEMMRGEGGLPRTTSPHFWRGWIAEILILSRWEGR